MKDIFSPDGGVKESEYMPDSAPAQMVKAIQTSKFPDLEDPTKDNSYKVVWMDNCNDDEPEDCSGDDCQIDGEEIGTQCANYELDICKESKGFTVTEKKFRTLGNTIDMQQEIAINLAKELKLMDEMWAKQVVTALDSNSGTNFNTAPYTVSGDVTNIPAASWNPDLFGYLAVTKNRNKLPNQRLFLGGLMEQYFWKIGMETGTPEGAANARKVAGLGQIYNDSFITEEVLGAKAAFLINPSSIALVTKAYNSVYGAGSSPIPLSGGGTQIRYTIKSPSIPGVVYDAYYQFICLNNDLRHTWKLRTKGNVLVNPTYCTAGKTGILQFRCV